MAAISRCFNVKFFTFRTKVKITFLDLRTPSTTNLLLAEEVRYESNTGTELFVDQIIFSNKTVAQFKQCGKQSVPESFWKERKRFVLVDGGDL